MINTDMRFYDYYKLGEENEYGQPQLPSLTSEPTGKILMYINLSSQAVTDNIKYSNCSYIGLTRRENVDDTYIIKYGNELLKVLYVNPKGRLTQVFLAEIV